VDILIGTQMIAKGHDFPNVTLVGVISADMSLNVNDFRAAERTFNLITQVSGRAGRGEKPGKVIIQTYESDNYSIVASQNHDYENFYNQEIIIRDKLFYPPFSDIIMINITGENEKNVINTANSVQRMFAEELKNFENTNVFPATPAPISKINNKFRWRIIIKLNITDEINNMINYLIKSEKFVKIKSAELTIDVNPAM
jgi:primosomal protein N' (replication factor Y)